MVLYVIWKSCFWSVNFIDAGASDSMHLVSEVRFYGNNNLVKTISVEQFCALATLPYEGKLLPVSWSYIYDKDGKHDLAPDGTPTIAITEVQIVNAQKQSSAKYRYDLNRASWLFVSKREATSKGWA